MFSKNAYNLSADAIKQSSSAYVSLKRDFIRFRFTTARFQSSNDAGPDNAKGIVILSEAKSAMSCIRSFAQREDPGNKKAGATRHINLPGSLTGVQDDKNDDAVFVGGKADKFAKPGSTLTANGGSLSTSLRMTRLRCATAMSGLANRSVGRISLAAVLFLGFVGGANATTFDELMHTIYTAHSVTESTGTIRFRGDDVATQTLQHTDGTVYGASYASGISADRQNEWEVQYNDGSGIVIRGIAQCNGFAGTWATANPDMIDPYTTVTENSSEKNCWCKMTGAKGANMSEYLSPSSASWVFNGPASSAAACADDCASLCAGTVRSYADFRSAVFGFGAGALNQSGNVPGCGKNLLTGSVSDYQKPRTAILAPSKSGEKYMLSVEAGALSGNKWMLRLRNKTTGAPVVDGAAIAAALAASDCELDASGASSQNGWIYGPAQATCAFRNTSDVEYLLDVAKENAYTAQPVMMEVTATSATTPSTFVAGQACISVATTAKVDADFTRTNYVQSVIADLVNNVVSNTISQAESIKTLATGKQTRPDETCAEYRQCLLVEGTDGTPHWYQIQDSKRDFFARLLNGTSWAQPKGTQSDGKWTYFNAYFRGDKAWRQTYVDGSASTYDRNWNSCSSTQTYNTEVIAAAPCYNDMTGNFKPLSDGEWAVVYEGDEQTGMFPKNGQNQETPQNMVVYGTSKCTSVGGTYAHSLSELNSTQQTNWAKIPNPVGTDDDPNNPRSAYTQCWCKMTEIGFDGEITNVANPSSASWVFRNTGSSAANCAVYCAYDCANFVRNAAGFRSAVFGSVD